MGNLLLFGTILSITLTSYIVGDWRFSVAVKSAAATAEASTPVSPEQMLAETLTQTQAPIQISPQTPVLPVEQYNIPHIGSIQVLNGCGKDGAANRMADFLQSKKFDVKDKGNAPSFNYPATMIISRTADMSLANEIEKFLKTGHVVFIRTNEQLYDVTVIAGPDFEDRMK
jgi:hypothetical protein